MVRGSSLWTVFLYVYPLYVYLFSDKQLKMEQMLGTGLDRAVILFYFAIVMGFGAYFGKYSKTTTDYFFGGRRFSWWLITISIVATGIGSHSFVKYTTKAYQYGFSSTMTYMNDWFFMPLFMFGWLPIIYYSKVRSIPE